MEFGVRPRGGSPRRYDQAGLEVIHGDNPKYTVPQNTDLEALDRSDPERETTLIPSSVEKEVAPTIASDNEDIKGEAPAEGKRPWMRKGCVILAVVILIVVIVGAVAGGIVASGSTEPGTADGRAATTSTRSPTATSTLTSSLPAPTSIASGSALAVAGCQHSGRFRIILSYLEPDGAQRFLMRSGVDGDNENDFWGPPQPLRLEDNPPLGAGIALSATSRDVLPSSLEATYFLYHLNETSDVGSMELTSDRGAFQPGALSGRGFAASANTNMAAYGPWIVYQTMIGELNIATFRESDGKNYDMSFPAEFSANAGTDIGIIFLNSGKETMTETYSMAVVFQRQNGSLAAAEYREDWIIVDEDRTINMRSFNQQWDAMPDLQLPLGTSFTAFRAIEVDVSKMFILYQDEDNNIQQLKRNDDDEWEPSSPRAFRGADEGTYIACINLPFEDLLSEEFADFYTDAPHLARCYFQRGGFLIETQLQGTEWVELGPVPIP